MVDPETCWRYLRASRADPPGLVSEGARRRTYSAALEQSEELWNAAKSLGMSTSPITLYYSLTQAGQATMAARCSGNEWRPKPSHGLPPAPPNLPGDTVPTLASFAVHDEGNGYFQQVASLLGCPSLPNDATLSALISSLPEGDGFIGTSPNSTPVRVTADDGFDSFDPASKSIALAWVSPVPDELIPDSNHVNPSEPEFMPPLTDVSDWLKPYPSLSGDNAPTAVSKLIKTSPHFAPYNQLRLSWTLKTETPTDYAAQRELIRSLISYPDSGVWRDDLKGVAIPSVANNTSALHPLATWWAILYAMSMLARYSPAVWMTVLNPDRSPDAERIRHVLDTAIDALPWLILLETATDT